MIRTLRSVGEDSNRVTCKLDQGLENSWRLPEFQLNRCKLEHLVCWFRQVAPALEDLLAKTVPEEQTRG